jgi:pimeloyl-ACP methyl ester carboxylesterase
MRDGPISFHSSKPPRISLKSLRPKLTMPVLTIGGEKSLGEALGQQTKRVATDVTVVVLRNTGHWVLEERPKDTTEALEKFL